MQTIRFLVESKNGHDVKDVPVSKAVGEINKHIADEKWVVAEKKDGTTQVITEPMKEQTEADIDAEFGEGASSTEKKLSIEDVKEATAINKAKGG